MEDMFHIMEMIVRPFERASSMQPSWNQPKENAGPSHLSVLLK